MNVITTYIHIGLMFVKGHQVIAAAKNKIERRKTMKDRNKFRAWDKKNKKYIYDVENGLKFWSTAGNLRVMTLAEIADSDKYDLEQCTGSRDCHGDLIYEGDILDIWEDMGISYATVVWNNELKKWDVEGDTEENYDFWELVDCAVGDKNNDVGVVGNIHENSELLEVE